MNPNFLPENAVLDYTTVLLPFGSPLTVWGASLVSFGFVTLAQQHFMIAAGDNTTIDLFPGNYHQFNFGQSAFSFQIDVGERDFEGTVEVDPFDSSQSDLRFQAADAEPVVYVSWDNARILLYGGFSLQTGPNAFLTSSNTSIFFPEDGPSVSDVNGTGGNDGGLTANSRIASDYQAATIVKRASEAIGSTAPKSLDGAFDFRPDANTSDAETIPHATVRAEWSGQSEYYSFTVSSQGGSATFDIDGSIGIDTVLRLYRLDGANLVLLATNDDASLDAGSTTGVDSRLTFDFTEGGIFYIQVDKFGGSTPGPDASYVLNVSLPRGQLAHPDVASGTAVFGTGIDGGVVNGLVGDDTLIGSGGDDRLDGGAGNDTASFSGLASVLADLAWGEAHGQGDDRLIGIENLIGGAGNDTLRGTELTNSLDGGAGNDTLAGRAGNDLVRGGAGADIIDGGADNDTLTFAGELAGVQVNLATGLGVGGNAQGDTYSGVENVIGSEAADRLTGDAAVNRLEGRGGNDVLIGGAGADNIDGSADIDTVSFTGNASAVQVNLATGLGTGGNAQGDTYAGIENVIGSDGSDTITGNSGANQLEGGVGGDTLVGGAGADLLIGGAGADAINGGADSDTVSFAGDAGSVQVNLALGQGFANNAQGDTYTGVENAIGSESPDSLIGDSGVNRLDGGGGNDTLIGALGADVLIGGAGIDTASYEDNQGAVFVNLTLGQGSGNAAQGDIFTGIENLTGGAFADYFIGDGLANRLDGGAGNDTLIGALGSDQLVGGTGTDTASYEDNQGSVFVNLMSGVGSSNAAQGDSYSGIENVTGSLFADTLIGDNGVNRLEGGAGNDTLIGGSGGDQLIGGTGTDTVSYEDNQGAITANLATGAGSGNSAQGDAYTSIENLTGSIFYDTLIGDANANTLNGRGGNDTLTGGGGSDIFTFDLAPAANNMDSITDFTHGADLIHLARSAFGALGLGQLASNAFATGSAATTAQHRIVYNSQTGSLLYDPDGSGAQAAVQIAQLSSGLGLTNDDFLVI